MTDPDESFAAWLSLVNEEIERFRALPRPPGNSFLGPDGRLDMDQVDTYYEGQDAPFRGERTGERKPKARI